MTCLTACRSQDSNSLVHTRNIFRRSFFANQQNILTRRCARDRFCCGECEFSRCRTRTGRDSLGQDFNAALVFGSVVRQEQLNKISCGDSFQRSFFVDQSFAHHFHGSAHCCDAVSFSISSLQHKQTTTLDGEFDVLHVAIMSFQFLANLKQLLPNFCIPLFHLTDRQRRANPCDNIFALRVDQEFAIKNILASRRIAGECDAGTGIIAHVSIRHRLHIDCSSSKSLDSIDLAI